MSEPSRHDSFLDQPGALDPLFEPRSIAILSGAEPCPLSERLAANLQEGGYKGVVHRHLDASASADLALITAPAPQLPELLERCAERQVGCAVVFTQMAAAEMDFERVRKPRLLGPNSIGLLRPWAGLHATSFPIQPRRGTVGFLTQSGALGAGILDWSIRANVGFSAFLSLGTMANVNWGDLIYRLGDDPRTRSILIYMESIGEARSFLSAAREVSLSKPIIVLKAGRTGPGARAAAEHGRQSIGDDDVLDAAFRRCGVLRVERISDLFYMSEVLSKQALPRGPRLAIVTNAAGPAVLAVDALAATGGELAERAGLPNPLGVPPGTTPAAFAQAVQDAAADPSADGVLAVLTPQSTGTPAEVAEALRPHAQHTTKPLLASFLGGREAASGVAILNEAGIPTVPYPDTAARSFTYMMRYARNLKNMYLTPIASDRGLSETRAADAARIFNEARESGRTLLNREECESLLEAYGIPGPMADSSPGHGVPLRIGSRPDEQFGPVLFLGAGGELQPFLPTAALALPPLNSTLVRMMVERSRVFDGISRLRLSTEPLEQALIALSSLVAEQPRIRSLTVDPLRLSAEGITRGGGTIELHTFETPDADLPTLAIRPYPAQYTFPASTKSGEPILIRPIRAEDEPAMVEFHKRLSERSVYFRYFQILNLTQRTAHERLTRICFIDYSREMALVAERPGGEILGVGRLSRLHGTRDAEFAVLVADACQGQGIGLQLLRTLVDVARAEGLVHVAGQILPENRGMIAVARKAGFEIRDLVDEGVVEASLKL